MSEYLLYKEWLNDKPGKLAVIGNPVKHSLSPKMHNAALAQLGMGPVYYAIEVEAEDFTHALNTFRDCEFVGVNITVPYKEAAYRWAKQNGTLSAFAAQAGAVNTIRFSDGVATNTDGPGLILTLESLGFPSGSSVLVLGAGGTSRSLLLALFQFGYEVTIWNRTIERAHELVSNLGISATISPVIDLNGFDVVINATSASLNNQPLPLSFDVPDKVLAYEVMYGRKSWFMEQAVQNGHRVLDGKEMLLAQGVLSFEFWTGQAPNMDAMREALHETSD